MDCLPNSFRTSILRSIGIALILCYPNIRGMGYLSSVTQKIADIWLERASPQIYRPSRPYLVVMKKRVRAIEFLLGLINNNELFRKQFEKEEPEACQWLISEGAETIKRSKIKKFLISDFFTEKSSCLLRELLMNFLV